jgi:hypothetical protein
VSFGFSNNIRTKTVNLYGEEIAFLGTHIHTAQVASLSKNTLKLISDTQFEHWGKRQNNDKKTIIEHTDNQCCICLTHLKNVVLMPCKHLCVCVNCSHHPSLTSCPLCKTVIELTFSVYL